MKKLIVPLAIALLSGIGSGTAFTVIQASRKADADAVVARMRADSISAAVEDSVSRLADAQDPGIANDSSTEDSAAHKDIVTPAESLRAVAAGKTSTAKATKSNTAETRLAAAPAASVSADKQSTASTKAQSEPRGTGAQSRTVDEALAAVKAAQNDARSTVLPEERLAKIFTAMQAKDAARVLGQMEDRDIRKVLSLMNDRQVAAILAALPAERAAAVVRVNKPEVETDK